MLASLYIINLDFLKIYFIILILCGILCVKLWREKNGPSLVYFFHYRCHSLGVKAGVLAGRDADWRIADSGEGWRLAGWESSQRLAGPTLADNKARAMVLWTKPPGVPLS